MREVGTEVENVICGSNRDAPALFCYFCASSSSPTCTAIIVHSAMHSIYSYLSMSIKCIAKIPAKLAQEVSSKTDYFATRTLLTIFSYFLQSINFYHDLAASIVFNISRIDLSILAHRVSIGNLLKRRPVNPATFACQHSNVANQSVHIHLYPQVAR